MADIKKRVCDVCGRDVAMKYGLRYKTAYPYYMVDYHRRVTTVKHEVNCILPEDIEIKEKTHICAGCMDKLRGRV